MQTKFSSRTPHLAARKQRGGKAAHHAGFTLIELLIVIGVISILAGLIFPVTRVVNQNKIRSKARAELAQLETAIENYKTALGHYPPDNPVNVGGGAFDYSRSQLFYELSGTEADTAGYKTIGGNIQIDSAVITAVFGVNGFVNSSRGGGDEGKPAKNFLAPQLSPAQIVTNASAGLMPKFIACSIPSPQTGTKSQFCYNASNPVHNKNSFDLWVDVMVGNQVNRICNWSDKPLIGVTTYP